MTRRTATRSLCSLVVTLAVAGISSVGVAGAAAVSRSTTVQQKTAITTNYQTFFNGKTPAKTKIKLLQNGSAFTSIIDAQASSSIAKSTTAKVTSVTVTSSTKATVKYSIYLAGTAALKNQRGTAVYLQGSWKVGTSSFCALLALEGTKTKACPAK